MLNTPHYLSAIALLTEKTKPVPGEILPIALCGGRVLAEDIVAADNVPPFDRSPYDGYALRSADTLSASKECPVRLKVTEEVAAGAVPTAPCAPGCAVKRLTGAPIPQGADCVVKYEKTSFDKNSVDIFFPLSPGESIIRAGEDVRRGSVLAEKGQVIDPGTAGILASQGTAYPRVFRRPRVGVISTGNELTEPGEPLSPGKIFNSNRYTLSAALDKLGCKSVYLGTAGDSAGDIAALMLRGLESCDALITTGGVSVGDYDLTPAAMELAGIEILFRGVDIKPGMACAYGVRDGKTVCGLSGNPASALTNFHLIAAPAMKKLAGLKEFIPKSFPVKLLSPFPKKSPTLRLLRGKLELSEGIAAMSLSQEQGNVIISSAAGCNLMAIVPPGSPKLEAGTILEGFMI